MFRKITGTSDSSVRHKGSRRLRGLSSLPERCARLNVLFSTWLRRGWRSRLLSLATRGIPELPAEVLGFFRIFYAAFLFIALSGRRLQIRDGFTAGDPSFRWAWVDWLVSRPDLVARLENAILLLLVLFAVGLMTRVAYALIAAGLTIWIVIMLQQDTNIHAWEVAFLTVLCLIPVPWGIAFSLDETIRRWRGRGHRAGARGKDLGFAVWMPGFIMGAVWAGAALTKVQVSGLQWMLGGAVKYHWVIDAPQAPVDWGLWVASHHWAAVVMSFLGVGLEAAFILAAFVSRSGARTLLASSIGGALVAGFYLFHGVLWWTWCLVLLLFAVPWHGLFNVVSSFVPERIYRVDLSSPSSRRNARVWHGLDWFNKLRFVDAATGHAAPWPAREYEPGPRPLRPIHGLLVCLICALMLREWPEGIGRFTSYSNTYASTADFDERNPTKPIDRLWIGYRTSGAVEVFRGSNDAGVLADAIGRLSWGEPLPPFYTASLQEIGERLAREHGDTRGRVTLVRERQGFDWEKGRFRLGSHDVIGTLEVNSMTFIPDGN